ncbi:long-chain fatty acid--CoA ligase [freshwater metagenome]|uniref:Long-chain fatty acid--CoA ligase n=1 Tax=freshwater metagenome TaxID=449393 RepID=A0A094SBK2_9ZZZZ
MRELSVPANIPPVSSGNVTDQIEDLFARNPQFPSVSIQTDDEWSTITAAQFREQVRNVAKGLIAEGLNAGDRIAILSRTRYEWTVADYAIWYAGCVTVPIYETSSPEQVEWIVSDSHVVATFFEAQRTTHAFQPIAAKVPHMTRSYIFSDDVLAELARKGANVSDSELESRRTSAGPSDPATLIYTSGTTGRPKGCIITHGNLIAEVDTLVKAVPEVFDVPEASTLIFLPLAHVFGRLIQVAMLRGEVTIGHCPNPTALLKDLGSFKPTFLLAVPRVFEKVFNGSAAKAHEASPVKGKIFDRAAATAIAYSEALDHGHVSKGLTIKHGLFDKLVYSKLRHAMGGRVTHAISGGAALGSRLGHFYRGIGLIILEGYGLTETTAGSTLNLPSALKIGSVGRPLPGTGARIESDGEILLKGPHVFAGYWNNDAATAEAMTSDGWFRTGDIGELDGEGYLRITGRKKELIVTAGGKNVAPAVLEDRLRANPIISQCVVVGDNKPYIGALVTLDQDALPQILAANNIESAPMSDLIQNADVRALVQKAVNAANEAVSNSEAIKKFVILPEDLTIDNGYLTPKMSIRRHLIVQDFAGDIEGLYA